MNKTVQFFLDNAKELSASFMLALLLWIVVTTDEVYTTKITVPLNIMRLAEGNVLLNLPPENVILEVSGNGRALIALNFYNPSFNLELPEINITKTIDLMDYPSSLRIPADLGIHIVDIIEPKTIKLDVDHLSEKKVPVKLQSIVKPSPGYILIGTQLSSDSVLVAGPASIIEKIDFIKNEEVLKQNVRYPFSEIIRLVVPKSDVTQVSPGELNATFQIEQLVERTVYNIPIQLVGIPELLEASAEPLNISVRIKGGETIVSSLTGNEITALFSYTHDYEEGRVNYPVQIETPANITVVEISPDVFRLQLKKKVIEN